MATEDWSCNGLEALQLQLCRSKAEKDKCAASKEDARLVTPFEPTFVYPIFGQEETIFGYRNLKIDLRFASGSLKQYLDVSYDEKFPHTGTGEVEADDPEKALYEFIPPSYSKDLAEFDKVVDRDARESKPLGVKLETYRDVRRRSERRDGVDKDDSGPSYETLEAVGDDVEGGGRGDDEGDEVIYEAYWSNWDTPGFKEFHRRAQIFVLLYIEGAQYIDEEDQRWEFVTLFERRRHRGPTGRIESSTYHFMGYVSFYSFFCWPDTKRLRLAQFVLLPPYQGQGHGSQLYNICYKDICRRSEISELTVEDPSEAFEDLRDKCDLETLISSGDLDNCVARLDDYGNDAKTTNGTEGKGKGKGKATSLDQKVTAVIDREWTERIRKKHKLADRQFYRLVEMVLLLQLKQAAKAESSSERRDRAFRLMVKHRLYLFNKEQLVQIDDAGERKLKLQETFESVVGDYERLLEKFLVPPVQ
ncbi:hypothetical protein JCM3766R1_000355 [Sporobolomyces carnicolor]